MHFSWLIIVVAICLVNSGTAITCYHCHQTSKACNHGFLNENHQKNCSEDKCAFMQYETQMPNTKVKATIRDCASLTEKELLHMVSPDKTRLATIIKFEECNKHLCNLSSSQICFRKDIFIIIAFVMLYFR